MKPTELSCELLPGVSPAGCHRRLLQPRPTPSYGRSPNLSPESRGTRRRGGRKRKWLAMAPSCCPQRPGARPASAAPASGRGALHEPPQQRRARQAPPPPRPLPPSTQDTSPRHLSCGRRGARGRNGFRPVFLTQLASAPTRFIVFQWPKLLLC